MAIQLRPEHRRDAIKALPLSAVQQAFITHASRGTLDDAARAELIHMLDQRVSAHAEPFYRFEKSNVKAALETGSTATIPAITTPETSLLWAINLAALAQKDPKHFYDSALWKQFSGIDGVAQGEKERLGFEIASTGLSGDTRLGWGKLNSSYYFSPTDARINLDLIMSLGVGFSTAASVAFHEIGHSILTKGFGEKIAALDAEITALQQEAKSRKLTQDEYKHLQRLSGERSYRYLILDEAENNAVDRWTVNHGRRIRRDHVLSRNTAEATIVDGLFDDSLDTVNDTPQNRFRNVKHAIRNSFFRNNGYFPDTEAGWRSIGINPDWITTADGKSGMAALAELKELCGGPKGVENLQPSGIDAMQGKMKLAAMIEEYSDRRNARIDEVYERFIAHVVEPLLEQQQEKLDEQMQQQQQDQEPEDQQGKGQEPSDEQGEGKGSGGQGESQEQSDEQGEPGEGQGSGGKESDSDEKPQSNQGQGSGGKESDSNEKSPSGGSGQGEGSADDDDDDAPPSSGLPGDDGDKVSETIEVEGVGEMPNPEAGPQKLKPETGEAKEPSPEEGQEVDESQSLEELETAREAKKEAQENGEGQGSDPSKRKTADKGFRPMRGAGSSNVDSVPLVGDWSDYQAMAIQFSPQIRQQQQHIDQLRARQIETLETRSPGLSLLPEDGDMVRLDRSAHAAMVKKILRGRNITEDDAARFQLDTTETTPSNMDVVLLLDGSGSTHSLLSKRGDRWPYSPIEAEMHSGCILNEACKNDVLAERGTRFYMGLWGNKTPMMIIQPGDDAKTIGERIAGIEQDHGWGTNLAPSIIDTTKQLAETQKSRHSAQEKTGYSHYIVMSDGGITDANASYQTCVRLLDNCPLASIDFVIIENGKTDMDGLADKLERAYPGRVAKHHFDSPEQVVTGIEGLLLNRIQMTPVTEAVSLDDKRRTLERAGEAMRR